MPEGNPGEKVKYHIKEQRGEEHPSLQRSLEHEKRRSEKGEKVYDSVFGGRFVYGSTVQYEGWIVDLEEVRGRLEEYKLDTPEDMIDVKKLHYLEGEVELYESLTGKVEGKWRETYLEQAYGRFKELGKTQERSLAELERLHMSFSVLDKVSPLPDFVREMVADEAVGEELKGVLSYDVYMERTAGDIEEAKGEVYDMYVKVYGEDEAGKPWKESCERQAERFFYAAAAMELGRDPEKWLSKEILERMLYAHVDKFKELDDTFRNYELPPLMEKFKKRAADIIKRHKLPLDISVIERRLSDITSIHLQDTVLTPLEENVGSFEVHSRAVKLSHYLLSGEIEEQTTEDVLTHELVHASMGVVIMHEEEGLRWVEGGHEHRSSDSKRRAARVGLKYVSSSGEHARFTWLNEALTESLAMELQLRKDGTYQRERRLFELLCEHVPRNLFIAAAFENYEAPAEGQEGPNPTREHSRKMWRAIAEKFGGGFMKNLDDCVAEEGIEVATAKFEADYTQFQTRKPLRVRMDGFQTLE